MLGMPRWGHEIIAKTHGYFWLPCPNCGQEFGGHELYAVAGHESSIPTGPSSGKVICPDCTNAGVGCRAWANTSWSIPCKEHI